MTVINCWQKGTRRHLDRSRAGQRLSLRCFNYKKEGHIAANCPSEPVLLCQSPTNVDARPPKIDVWHRTGTVEGQFVNEIVLDTACKRTIVHQELVPSEKIIEGDVATIRCAHGDTVLYPLANIEMKVDDQVIQLEAAVLATLPVPVLLEGDVPELKQLLGSNTQSDSTNSDDVMVVVACAQAKRQLEEEIIQKREKSYQGQSPTQWRVLKSEVTKKTLKMPVT